MQIKSMFESLESTPAAERRIPIEDTLRKCNETTERFCCTLHRPTWPTGNASDEFQVIEMRLHELLISQIGLLAQYHNYHHVPSCFKKSNMGTTQYCRYCFPRKCVLETFIDEEGILNVKRLPHNEYINTFNEVLLLLLRANHDIRFLMASGTADAVYYCLKYVTKIQNAIDSVEGILMTCFEKRIDRESTHSQEGPPLSPVAAGRGRVNSMSVALCKMQEIAAPMAALYLRRGSAMYSSHDFAPLLLGQAMAVVQNLEHEITLVRTVSGQYMGSHQYNDFYYRHSSLVHMTLLEFVANIQVLKSNKRMQAQLEEEDKNCLSWNERTFFSLHEGHPFSKTHIMKRRSPTVIPDIIGPRIPDQNNLTTDDDREKYGLIALILLSPFHCENQLSIPKKPFWDSFQTLMEGANSFQKDMLRNFQEYYESKTAAKEQRTKMMTECIQDDREDGASDYESENPHDVEDFVEYTDILTVATRGVMKAFKPVVREHIDSMCTEICTAAFQYSKVSHDLPPHDSIWSRRVASAGIDKRISEEYAEKSENLRSHSSLLGLSRNAIGGHMGSLASKSTVETKTTVELLQNAISFHENPRVHAEGTLPASQNPSPPLHFFPHIADVSRKFNLNKLQKIAFEMCASALLKRILSGYCDSHERNGKSPFSMYIGGEGGTGKTRVIESLLLFAKHWNCGGSVRTCAPTGIAASLVGGKNASFPPRNARGVGV